MKNEQLNQVVDKFLKDVRIEHWTAFGNGHINDTFLGKTTASNQPDYILQRKNHGIFKNIPGMMKNISLVTDHIRNVLQKQDIRDVDRRVMTYLRTLNGEWFARDKQGNYWTLFLYIPGSHSVENIENPAQAYQAAQAFGHFQYQLSGLSGEQLIETISDFHNGLNRLDAFEKAIEADTQNRAGEIREIIEPLLDRSIEMTRLQVWLDNGEIPLRITHNDTKINNILFDSNNQPLCIIDLDTVMPGSALYDFGDAIRTIGNTVAEDDPDLEKIEFAGDIFRAFAEGYLSEAGKFLTDEEKENLGFACRYMAWEQAVRFLTDYLNGDVYYKISYPEHNLVRAKNQLRYLEVLEMNSDMMESVITASV